MNVAAIMTKDVVKVSPDAPIHEAASLMVDHAISGLPVVDEAGRLAGIISEGDLIVRQKPRERVPWWRLFFDSGERLAREYQKAVGRTVGEVMTRSVISVSPDLPVESAALILDKHQIRRLPVVAKGELVGIVSRGDLIKALATAPPAGTPVSDARLVAEMTERMSREPWAPASRIVVNATDGVLSLWGLVSSESERSALETMARAIDGCKGVDNHLLRQSEIPYHYGA